MTDDPFTTYRPAVAAAVAEVLESQALSHGRLMRYHMGLEDEEGQAPVSPPIGTHLAPMALLTSEVVGGSASNALPVAAAIELIGNFRLAQEDIEAERVERDGRATVLEVWGMPRAVNAGDGLYSMAQIALQGLSEKGMSPEGQAAIVRAFDGASLRSCEGQFLATDLDSRDHVRAEAYLAMAELRTGALLGLAAEAGALAGGAGETRASAFRTFGVRLGVAHHLQADYRRTWALAQAMRGHAWARRWTYPMVLGVEDAGTRETVAATAREYVKASLEAIGATPVSAAGRRRLAEAAHYLGTRGLE